MFRKIRVVCVYWRGREKKRSNGFILNPCTSCLRAAAVKINYLMYTFVHLLPFPCFSPFFLKTILLSFVVYLMFCSLGFRQGLMCKFGCGCCNQRVTRDLNSRGISMKFCEFYFAC